jgi:hypothetical protein
LYIINMVEGNEQLVCAWRQAFIDAGGAHETPDAEVFAALEQTAQVRA